MIPEDAPTILVAEDERDMRRLLERRLTRKGYRVVGIGDGMTLRTYLRACLAGQEGDRVPDLLVSDIDMPGLDGLEALRGVPDAAWRLPTIFVTGMANPPSAELAQSVGAHAVLRKPIDFEELFATIERLLGASKR